MKPPWFFLWVHHTEASYSSLYLSMKIHLTNYVETFRGPVFAYTSYTSWRTKYTMGENSSDIHQASKAILEYYFPIIGIPGLFGNVFALFILLQLKNRTLPCYRTLSALSCADIVILLCGIYQWIAQVFLDGMSDTVCTIWTYIFQVDAKIHLLRSLSLSYEKKD